MAFDKNSEGKPIVDVTKRTTRVNVWLAIGVCVFLLLVGVYMLHYGNHPAKVENDTANSLKVKP